MSAVARNSGAVQRQWLRKVLADANLKPSALAKKIDVSPSTLLRFLEAPDDSPRTMHAGTVDKIVAATGFAPPDAENQAGRRVARGLRADGVPFKAGDHTGGGPLEAALRALSANRNGVAAWTLRTRCLEAVGLLPGDVVMVDLNRSPKLGDVVCAEIRDADGRDLGTTFRFYEPPYLVAASSDPGMRKPLIVDGDRVAIVGVVTHELRALTSAA